MIDFSHANSQKDYRRQAVVCHDVAAQIAAGNRNIIGAMIESNLVAGAQKLVPGQPSGLWPKHHRRLHRLEGNAHAARRTSRCRPLPPDRLAKRLLQALEILPANLGLFLRIYA